MRPSVIAQCRQHELKTQLILTSVRPAARMTDQPATSGQCGVDTARFKSNDKTTTHDGNSFQCKTIAGIRNYCTQDPDPEPNPDCVQTCHTHTACSAVRQWMSTRQDNNRV